MKKINLKGIQVSIVENNNEDYISLTDMAKYKTYDSGIVISNWLTTKYTIQFMGAWEQLHNPNFNLMEFHKIKNEADVLNKALFGMTAKEWRDENPKMAGNMRDYADVTQLVVLANLEGLNAEFIRQGVPQRERLLQLNHIAIYQMQSLLGNPTIKKLNTKNME